jgi:hypothetical protein
MQVAVGSREDLGFRLQLDDQSALPTQVTRRHAVTVAVQIRFPEELLGDAAGFIKALGSVEEILDPSNSPFPHAVHLSHQLDRFWFFGLEEDRDDAVFEALVSAMDAISRFKKGLETSPVLSENRARIAIGISQGDVARISRGVVGPVTLAGKSVYMAETLAEAAGDLQIYVDEQIHRYALPLFDFREWKPLKLRSPIPPVAVFEVVGWNKKEEIFTFINHTDASARRAVAVSYRYLDFDDLTPLLNLLADTDERVAMETLATIKEIKDERALGILKKILPEAKNPVLKSAVIAALGGIGKDEVVPALVGSLRDNQWQVRFSAVQAICQICGPDSRKHLEPMADDEDGAVRAAVRKILYLQTHDRSHLEQLSALLHDLSQRARKAAVDALLEISEEASLRLAMNVYFEVEPELQRHILRLLMESKHPQSYACFLDLFQKADERGRADIAQAVRRAKT